MNSSGTIAKSTSSPSAVLVVSAAGAYNYAVISNEGAAGFFSVDAGTTWARLSAGQNITWRGLSNKDLMIKRDGSTDMSGVYAWTDWLSSGGHA